jgi:hypothetical protein
MRNPWGVSSFSVCVLLCPLVTSSLGGCTFHEDSEPPAQSAPVAIAPAPAPAPVSTPAVATAPAAAAPAQGTAYRPAVEAPNAPARASASNGAASAPPATHVATAPAAGVAVAPPAGVASAPAAGGYVDDPAVVVNTVPPPPRPDLLSRSPGPAYAWVPGHWAWRNAWVWVAGSFQVIPAGRHQWVAGQWLPQGGQYRWQPGYWA